MGIENTTTIAGLVTANPTSSDPVYEGPDHFRLIKRVLKGMFPGSGGQGFAQPIIASEADLNASSGLSTAEVTRGKTLATIIADLYSKIGSGSSGGGGGTPAVAQAFPIGSVYMTYSPANPASILGYGTWSRAAQGKFIVGVDESDPAFDTIGKTGGSKHAIIPAHKHVIVGSSSAPDTNASGFVLKSSAIQMGDSGSYSVETSTPSGSTQVTNANLPPYITCFIWKRDA